MIPPVVFWMRLVTMILAGGIFGVSFRVMWPYFIAKPGTADRGFVVLGGLSYCTWVFGYVWQILDKVLKSEPWEFHTTPLALFASTLGALALYRRIERRREPRMLV